jgi:diguanylate cyclase (GGDEF)-like protein
VPKLTRKSSVYIIALLFAGVILLVSVLSALLVQNPTIRSTVMDTISPFVELVAAAALFLAAKNSFTRSRREGIAWGIIALAMLSYAMGDITWAWLEIFLKEPPFPSVADFFYLFYIPVFLVGIFLLSSRSETKIDRVSKVLDIAIVMACAILGFWNLLIGPTIHSAAGLPATTQAILIAYPAGDLVLLWAMLLILYSHLDEKKNIPSLILAAGLLVMIITDSIYGAQSFQGTYTSGGFLDIGWILSVLLIGLGGVEQIVSIKTRIEFTVQRKKFTQGLIKAVSLVMPYLWLVMAYILLTRYKDLSLPMDFTSLSLAVGGIITLVLIRQVITLFENQRLNSKLLVTNEDLENEIVERRRMEAKLSYDALHDAMTGLPNRALFLDRLEHSLETTRRHPDLSYAVLFVDLDHFKVVNDSLGHLVGDKLLIMVGKRLETALRSSDSVARFGGDEFGILLEAADPDTSIRPISQKILDVLKPAFKVETHEVHISASIGIVKKTAGYISAEEILRDADIAMYRAKEMGRHRYEVFDINMRNQAYTRLELENEMRAGLEKKEFQLFYQPIILLESKRLVGFEALIRWFHPTRGLMLPGQFLSIAEESGLIQPISDWVLNEACSQLKTWQKAFPALQYVSVSVNISSNYFAHPNFVEKVIKAVQSKDLKAESLKLEITEGVLINNYAVANSVFKKLQDFGIRIQIDDFGTGYSALEYLQNYPVDAIKIDRSFINGLGKGEKSSKLVRAMISMARELGMEIIAEGIETDAQLMELKNSACGYGQGFLLSLPLDSSGAKNMLARLEDKG